MCLIFLASSLEPELNVDHMVGVMADFRATQDWFYSFRWVPPRFFRNKLQSHASPRTEAVYTAHKALSPQSSEELIRLGPREYRRRYKEIMVASLPGDVKIGYGNAVRREKRQRRLSDLLA